VAEAHEEPKCGKGADAWQTRLAPWLACAAAGSGGVAAAPGPKLPSARKARAVAGTVLDDGDGSGGEDSIAGLQGSAGSFAEVRFAWGQWLHSRCKCRAGTSHKCHTRPF
jgi:hypothetical protein